jgi:hypothetical protein
MNKYIIENKDDLKRTRNTRIQLLNETDNFLLMAYEQQLTIKAFQNLIHKVYNSY